MIDISKLQFKRKFAMNFYKNLRLDLGCMSLSKDFVNDKRGDMYPITENYGEISETVCDGMYTALGKAESGISRFIGGYFPYASYEMEIEENTAFAGFELANGDLKLQIGYDAESKCIKLCKDGECVSKMDMPDFILGSKLEISCRINKFDIYIKAPGATYHKYFCTFTHESFTDMKYEDNFKNTSVSVFFRTDKNEGKMTISDARFYLDSGVSIADMRPIRYENGDILTEDGKVFLTVSLRLQEEMYQGVLEWLPGTSEFNLCGAIFYDIGDGIWGNDVAATVVFNRKTNKWNIWYCSFSHGHILASCECEGDVRYGVNVLDTKLIEKLPEGADDKVFLGKDGDEDPNFIFDEKANKWYMTVCRLSSDGSGYKYFLFESESDNPFEGWKYVTNSTSGEETGGSILKLADDYFFVCGNSFRMRANYRVYKLPDFENYKELKFDFDDGGFRGWGTIIPIKKGTRTVYYHLTFDRHLGSSVGYNWSYGNIYCFEGYEPKA
ncbi:MAG: hypothetical protein IKU43_01245 [Clostridia bacterium]|nr:hypothetical protein [Clostridia bacterium]